MSEKNTAPDTEELRKMLEARISEYNELITSLKEKHKEADALLKKMRLEYKRMLKEGMR